MTPRVRFVLQARWKFVGQPSDGWVWPAPPKSGHVDHSSLKKQHARTFRVANAEIKKKAEENQTKPALLKPWVLYSFRHTFLTRLGESGAMSNVGGTILVTVKKRRKFRRASKRCNLLRRREREKYGAPGEIRTPDLMLRRHSLYPAELRARSKNYTRCCYRKRNRCFVPNRSRLSPSLSRIRYTFGSERTCGFDQPDPPVTSRAFVPASPDSPLCNSPTDSRSLPSSECGRCFRS